uniref:Small EDRK-rich factor-like N-terminal domain-containing protein n=1 Tax=Oryctolagus cuniculus TaxID=9986 RepID=A0A5F9C4P0_RABIT
MARQQKIQSQLKDAKKQAGLKKKQGREQKAAAIIHACTVCRIQMPDPMPFRLADVQAQRGLQVNSRHPGLFYCLRLHVTNLQLLC